MANKDSVAGFGWGLLVGAVVGAAIGILYAPRPGRETRQIVRERAEAAAEVAREKMKDARETAQLVMERAEAAAERAREKVRAIRGKGNGKEEEELEEIA